MNETSTPATPVSSVSSHTTGHAKSLGAYWLDELIAEYPGFAVFVATHQERHQSVILYLVPPAGGNELPQFQHDVKVASTLDHPSIAKIVDVGEAGGIPFVAYEKIDGISVQSLVKMERKLPPSIACAIVRQAAIGLHHVHERGLLHGGITPANLFITKTGVVKIQGLGVAAYTLEQPQRPGATEGSKYVAPEQVASGTEVRSDIYALGCTLYHMLTGEQPASYFQRSRKDEAFRLNDEELGSSLASVVRAMTELDISRRVQLLNQVVGTMCNWANDASLPRLVATHMRTDKPSERPPASGTEKKETEKSAHKPQSEAAAKKKRRRWPMAAASTVAILGIVAGFVYLNRQHQISSEKVALAVAAPAAGDSAKETLVKSAGDVPVSSNQGSSEPSPKGAAAKNDLLAQATGDGESDSPGNGLPSGETATNDTNDGAAGSNEASADGSVAAQAGQSADERLELSTLPTSIEVPRPAEDLSADAYHNHLQKQLQEEFGLTNGKWVLTPNEFALISSVVSYGQKVTQDETSNGVDFARLVRMQVANKGENPWSSGLYIPEVQGIENGDRVLVVVWLRTSPGSSVQEGKVGIYVESATDHTKEVYLTVKPTPEWRQFLIPFQAKTEQRLRVGFHLAFQAQDIDYGGLTLINFGKTAPFWNAIPAGPKHRPEGDSEE